VLPKGFDGSLTRTSRVEYDVSICGNGLSDMMTNVGQGSE
jgi:hypothetical protein